MVTEQRPLLKSILTLVLLCAVAVVSAPNARASAMFSADASLTVTLVSVTNDTAADPTDLTDFFIDGFFIDIPFVDELVDGTGAGTASASPALGDPFTLAPLAIGDSVSIFASASGSASAPGGGVDEFANAFAELFFFNDSFGDSFTIELSFDAALATAASFTDVDTDDSVAHAEFIIDTFDAAGALIDLATGLAVADGFFGPEVDDSTPTGTVFLTLAPGEGNSIGLFVIADGFAEVVTTPEPSVNALLLGGLGVWFAVGRRARRRSA
jgi:hypothetical protein